MKRNMSPSKNSLAKQAGAGEEALDPIISLKKTEDNARRFIEESQKKQAVKLEKTAEKADKIVASAREESVKIRNETMKKTRAMLEKKIQEIMSSAEREVEEIMKTKVDRKLIQEQIPKIVS